MRWIRRHNGKFYLMILLAGAAAGFRRSAEFDWISAGLVVFLAWLLGEAVSFARDVIISIFRRRLCGRHSR